MDAIMGNWKKDPNGSMRNLRDIEIRIKKDFGNGRLDDTQYLLLTNKVKENLEEIGKKR
jgi:hypothetical protein